MLGLIYTIIISIGLIIYSIKEKRENEECKTLYKHKDGLTYTDLKGRSRLIADDTIVFYTHDKYGNYILEDASGYVYKNFSAEERKKRKKEFKQLTAKTGSTYYIDEDQHKKDWLCQGRRFIDIKTEDVYVIRYINGKYYYMNTFDGMLVRKTDWQVKKDQEENIINRFNNGVDIEVFNKKQKNIQNKLLLYRDFDYNSLCDYHN